jgi:hypothetical protein
MCAQNRRKQCNFSTIMMHTAEDEILRNRSEVTQNLV